MILTLERNGFIRRTPGASRSIEVLVSPDDLPVLQTTDQVVKISVQRY
jgi:repressor LexA